MAPGRPVSNQQSFDFYRRSTGAWLARPVPLVDTGSAWGRNMQIVARWSTRYTKRRDFIQGDAGWGQTLADTAAAELLIARNLTLDARYPQVPDWDDETRKMIEMSLKNTAQYTTLDASSLAAPCRYGPSLRRLWAEAKARGQSDEQAWEAISAWAFRPLPPWKGDVKRSTKAPKTPPPPTGRFAETTVWHKSGDIYIPWTTEHAGETWQVRLNDFPDEPMYTLLVNGNAVEDFNDWPEAWDRGDQAAPVAEARPQQVISVKGRFLERYMAGEHEAVWAELVSLGPEVRSPRYLPEAIAVARETMRRARHNVEVLILRLDEMGYQFWVGSRPSTSRDHLHDSDVFLPPASDAKGRLDEFEEQGYILPLSLRMWMEQVGRVELIGAHPTLSFLEYVRGFPGIYADPLMVTPTADSLEDMLGLGGESEGDFFISFDARAKAAVGTNEQLDTNYWIELPCTSADAVLKGYPSEITFVEYLRLSFRWGGFPGWKDRPHPPELEISALTHRLLPL